MDNRKEILLSSLNSLDLLLEFREHPNEIAEQFSNWINNFSLALQASKMDAEWNLWEDVLSSIKFSGEDSSLPSQMLNCKSLLLGMINGIESIDGEFRGELIDNIYTTNIFYYKLISEINCLYERGFVLALWVLIRKLFENLIIDILRKQYGTISLDLYFDVSKRKFQSFSVLINNFKLNKNDFIYVTTELDNALINEINEFRETGNSSAHSIDVDLNIDDFTDRKERINYLTQFLFRLLDNISS